MAHPFTVREIARQADVSDARVDLVLHGRPGVRSGTARQVQQAIQDSEAQRHQMELEGRRFMIDVVAAAPAGSIRWCEGRWKTSDPFLLPGVFRTRFHLYERWSQEDCITRMDQITAKGSHGVVLMAPDVQEAVAAVDRLQAVGIPVITLASDLPVSRLLAYVSIDNRSAGVTADISFPNGCEDSRVTSQ